jgi:hypothetical protein
LTFSPAFRVLRGSAAEGSTLTVLLGRRGRQRSGHRFLSAARGGSRGAGAPLALAGRTPAGRSAGVEITRRVYKPRRARESPLFSLVEQHLEERLRVSDPLRPAAWPAAPGGGVCCAGSSGGDLSNMASRGSGARRAGRACFARLPVAEGRLARRARRSASSCGRSGSRRRRSSPSPIGWGFLQRRYLSRPRGLGRGSGLVYLDGEKAGACPPSGTTARRSPNQSPMGKEGQAAHSAERRRRRPSMDRA